MKYSTHVVTALSVSTALVAFEIIRAPDFSAHGFNGIMNYVAFWVVIAVSSLLPDIDHANSYISNKLGFSLPFKHRGFTHYVYIWFALIYMGYQGITDFSEFFLWMGVGGLLHSFGDMHTKGGVKLFGFGKKGMTVLPSFLTFKTGNSIEYVFLVGYCMLLGISVSKII